ncbi:MAG: hypothetical protein E6Q97_21335 [Desulfurellales bacterium]|nr:MAG: hypothetical protein E6Q97_21335 [Desulfurellales bacterium]
MGTMLTSEEYAELNQLRREKAQREIDNQKLAVAALRLAKVTDEIRELIDVRKRSRMPDGGGR